MFETVTALQLSLNTGAPSATLEAVQRPASVVTFLSGGQLMRGAVLSTKMMCWVQIADWPPLLVAVQMRLMPARPVQFAGVATSVKVRVTLPPPQASLAVARPVLFVVVDSPHCKNLSSTHVRSGVPAFTTATFI